MRKIVLFLVLLLAPLVLSSVEAAVPIDLGKISYTGNTLVFINETFDVSLSLLYEPILNGLRYNKLGYNPITNQTAYSFFSNTLVIDWKFVNDTKIFYFQEITSNQIYTFSIDYRNVTVPPNPWKLNYTGLLMRYNNTLENYTRVNLSLANLTTLLNTSIMDMNASLAAAKRNSTLAENKLVNMSLNVSFAETTIHSLYREKENLGTNLLVTQVVMGLMIPFSCILCIFIGRRYGLFDTSVAKDRLKKRLETGFSKVHEWYDRGIVDKNDEITVRKPDQFSFIDEDGKVERREAVHPRAIDRQPVFEDIPPRRPSSVSSQSEAPSTIHDEIDRKLGMRSSTPITSRAPPPSSRPKGDGGSMLSKVQIVKKLYEEGVDARQISGITGFDSQFVNTIVSNYEESRQ